MPRMTGGQALVEMLRRHGVDTLFAIPGVQNDAFFNALYDAHGAIRVIHTRHEQGAAYMAFGYAKTTGKVGTYSVVPGPGFLNTTAALGTAYAESAPVLCLAGQIPSHAIGRGWGMLHEIPDQLAILRGLTKWAARVEHPTQMQRVVDEAFHQLGTGRPRPVGIEIPPDVLSLETDVQLLESDYHYPKAAPDAQAIAKAAELLGAAAKPLIIVGSGVDDAGADLVAVAEMLQAPVVAATNGKGVVSARHCLSLSRAEGQKLWAEVDVVLGVGTRMSGGLNAWGVDEALKIVRIDIDPVEINRVRAPTIGIVADAALALAALREQLCALKVAHASREGELSALKEEFDEKFSQVQPQYDYLHAIRDALPEDGILVDEVTQVGYAANYAFPVYRPRTLVTSGYEITLGYGFATALGAKVAHPDKAVVSINGDGGFMYNVQELATAVLHKIGVAAIVFNDNRFGNVYRMQKENYGGRFIASELRNPDFVKLAESFGAVGARATSPSELRAALTAAFGRSLPTLIEVPVGEMPRPHAFFATGRVRG